AALLHELVTLAVVDLVRGDLADEQVPDLLVRFLADDPDLVLRVLLDLRDLVLLDREGPKVLVDSFAGEDLHVDDRALDSGRTLQRRVAHVAGLFAKDRAEELLFGGELRLALRRDLPD